MIQNKRLSAVFAAVGILLALLAVILSVCCHYAPPVLVQAPDAASARAEALMEALSEGAFDRAEAVLYGAPSLGADREPADAVGGLLWDAFCDSMEYQFSGELYATDTGLARDVTVTTLELTSVTEHLKERSEALLEKRIATAEDVSQIYDENNDYREDFVMDVLYDAAAESLEKDAQYTTKTVKLNLVYHQRQWWVMPDRALLQLISGGTVS